MLPLPLRNWIFGHWIRPNEKLIRVPWITLGDGVFLPKIGADISRRFLKDFYIYRKNIKSPLEFGIGQFYPRSGYLLYYFFLFTWADSCKMLEKLLDSPEHSLIAEAFMRHIIEIDREIDNQDGVKLLERNPTVIRSDPRLSRFRSQLLGRIAGASLPADIKSNLTKELIDFEITCQDICRKNSAEPIKTLQSVLVHKENTVGALFEEWASFLNLAYEVSPENHHHVSRIFWNTGMALQMLDDTLDVPIDLENETDNVFLCIVKENKKEWIELKQYLQYLKTTPWKHLDTAWANQHTPETLSKIRVLGYGYLSNLKNQAPEPTNLIWVMDRMWVHAVGI